MAGIETDYLTGIRALPRGVTLFFHDVPWEEYKALIEEPGQVSSLRLTYDNGTLQVMTTSRSPEDLASIIGKLFVAFEDELDCPIQSYRSATLMKEESEKGTEPDDCFYIQNAKEIISKNLDIAPSPPPDLAIEIDLTSPFLSKFPIYATLGVPEIWRYKGGRVQFFQLNDGEYHEISRSLALPFLPSAVLAEFIRSGLTQGQTAARKAFAKWVKVHQAQSA